MTDTAIKSKDPLNDLLTTEYSLDGLLGSALANDVPEDVIKGVTPWKRAMRLVFAGLILSFIGQEFFPIDLPVSLVGFLCMFLGFRRFRKENKAFAACMWLALAGLVLSLVRVFVTAFSVRFEMARGNVNTAVEIASWALMLLISICFGSALCKVEYKAQKYIGAAYAIRVPVWYVVAKALVVLTGAAQKGAIEIQHIFILFVFMTAALALFIHALVKLMKELQDPGYAIETAVSKVPDKAVVIGIVVLIAALYAGGLFARHYKTDWQAWTPNTQRAAETESAGKALASQGIRGDVLEMMTDAEISEIAGGTVYAMDEYDRTENGPEPSPCIKAWKIKTNDSWYRLLYFEWPEGTMFGGTEGVAINAPVGSKAVVDGVEKYLYGNYLSGRVVFAGNTGSEAKTAELFTRRKFYATTNPYYEFYLKNAGFYLFDGFSVPAKQGSLKGVILLSDADPTVDLYADLVYVHQTPGFKVIAVSAKEDVSAYLSTAYPFSIPGPGLNAVDATQHTLYMYQSRKPLP